MICKLAACIADSGVRDLAIVIACAQNNELLSQACCVCAAPSAGMSVP